MSAISCSPASNMGVAKAANIQRCLDSELYFYAVNIFDTDLTF